MTICTIFTEPLANLQIEITAYNNKKIKVSTVNQNFKMEQGWQIITVRSQISVHIKDVLIGGQSIRENLYTSWATDKDDNFVQPCSHIDSTMGWCIILNDNQAIYKEQICRSIKNNDYGKNLFELYQPYLDLGTTLKKHYTSQINLFFEHSFGFNYYDKCDYGRHPFTSLDIPYDHELFFDDIKDIPLEIHPNKNHRDWYKMFFRDPEDNEKTCKNVTDLPVKNIREWFLSLGIKTIRKLQVSLLKPDGYIELHKDDTYTFDQPNTISNSLHIPIFHHPEAMIKTANGGIMPQCINVLNNAYHVHGGVNTGKEDRYVLLVTVELDQQFIDKYKKNVPVYKYEC